MQSTIQTIGIVGIDQNGIGWAARCLAHGLDVIATDPDPQAESRLHEGIDQVWPILEKLGLISGANRTRLRFTQDSREVGSISDFIQINSASTEVVHATEASATPDIVIAFNSADAISEHFQAGCQHPERVVIGQAWHPVYLTPLVEVMRFEETNDVAVQKTIEFYRWLTMHPVQVADHSVAQRLQSALQREAQRLIDDGLTTAAEIDDILCYGPGLQWGVTGLMNRVDEPLRDEAMLGIMRTLRQHNHATGNIIAAHDAKRYTRFEHRRWHPDDVIDTPLKLYRCDVDPNWIDYNGHMTESSYLTAFGDASDALFRYIGIDEAYRASGNSYYTVETHINYYLECGSGDTLEFSTQILDFDSKRLHFFHNMYNSATGDLVCTTEQMLIHVDTAAGRASPVQPHVSEALHAILNIHQTMPIPKQIGRQMKIRRN